MARKAIYILVIGFGMLLVFGCAGLEKSKDFAASIIPREVDEKLYNQVPEEQKDSINPLLDAVSEAKGRLKLAKALVNKQEKQLDLEKATRELAGIELKIREAELDLGKMEAVQSAGLGDTKKINQQVAKLEAKVYKLKGEESKQKASVENAKLSVAEAQQEIEALETQPPDQAEEAEPKENEKD